MATCTGAGQTSPTVATPSAIVSTPRIGPSGGPQPLTTRPPLPAQPVPLVADGITRPGVNLVCGLKPKGWKAVVYKAQNGGGPYLEFTDPAIDPTKYASRSTVLYVGNAGIYPGENGRMEVEKYGRPWDELPHVMAGSRQAVAASGSGMMRGSNEVHMRMSSTKLIQVTSSRNLGWDLPTLLRFTGSCGFVK